VVAEPAAEPAAGHSASPVAHATAEEIECILRWLESPGTRLVEVSGTWCCPAFGAGGQRALLDLALEAIDDADPFGDRRGLRPVHQPAREVQRAAG
jgi:DNA polymerase III subunit epsilon